MEATKKIQIENNWLRLLAYFFTWFALSFFFYIPILLFGSNANEKRIDIDFLRSNLVYVGATQIAACLSVFAATYLIVRKVEGRNFSDIKFTINFSQISKGFALSAAVILVLCLIMQITKLANFSYSTISPKIIFSFVLFGLVSLGEEVMIRGYVLNNLREKMNNYHAVLISSAIFGSMHFFNENFTLIGFLNIMLSGILLGILFIKSNTLSAPIGLHWGWNFIQGPIAGFNVSGHKESGIFTVQELASGFLTGGDFGAEGSILIAPILLISIYMVWKYWKSAVAEAKK